MKKVAFIVTIEIQDLRMNQLHQSRDRHNRRHSKRFADCLLLIEGWEVQQTDFDDGVAVMHKMEARTREKMARSARGVRERTSKITTR